MGSFSIPYVVAAVEKLLGWIRRSTKLSGGVSTLQERMEPKADAVIHYRRTECHSDELRCSRVFSSSLFIGDLETAFECWYGASQCIGGRKMEWGWLRCWRFHWITHLAVPVIKQQWHTQLFFSHLFQKVRNTTACWATILKRSGIKVFNWHNPPFYWLSIVVLFKNSFWHWHCTLFLLLRCLPLTRQRSNRNIISISICYQMKVWVEAERARLKTGKSMENSGHMCAACRLSVMLGRDIKR